MEGLARDVRALRRAVVEVGRSNSRTGGMEVEAAVARWVRRRRVAGIAGCMLGMADSILALQAAVSSC